MQTLTNVRKPTFAGMEQHVLILKVLTLALVRKKPYRIPTHTLSVLA